MKIRVIARQGLRIPGPAVLRLSADQLAVRPRLGGKPGAPVTVPAGMAVTFKQGEELSVDDPSKVARLAFEEIEAKAKAAAPDVEATNG